MLTNPEHQIMPVRQSAMANIKHLIFYFERGDVSKFLGVLMDNL